MLCGNRISNLLASLYCFKSPKMQVKCFQAFHRATLYKSPPSMCFKGFKLLEPSSRLVLCRKLHTATDVETNSEDSQMFNSRFQEVLADLTHENEHVLKDATDWFSKVCQYNLRNGKKNRGLAVVKACKIFSGNKLSEMELNHACIIGWCVELLQAYFLVCDDIMDQSQMRRGELCWYRQPDVGFCAINDALMLQGGIYKILRKHFENCEFYSEILHKFLEVTQKTVYGQCLDMLSCPPTKRPCFGNFSYEKYFGIVEYKTSHYTYCLPVHLAMHLDGKFTPEDFKIAELLCLKLGQLFQIQDDYLDCYGTSELTGKVGNDINQGKCSWFAVSLFELGSAAMKKEMVENYGYNTSECITKVLKLYEELNLREKYYSYEDSLHAEILSSINQNVSNELLKDLFYVLLQKTYKRKK